MEWINKKPKEWINWAKHTSESDEQLHFVPKGLDIEQVQAAKSDEQFLLGKKKLLLKKMGWTISFIKRL